MAVQATGSSMLMSSRVILGALAAFSFPMLAAMDNAEIFSDRFEPVPLSRFFLDDNGVTIRCPAAAIGEKGEINGVVYTRRTREQITGGNAHTSCTSGITDMSRMFVDGGPSQLIGSWDTSSVTNMSEMFLRNGFNQPIGAWDTRSVTDMSGMFADAIVFNQPIGSWDTSSVTDMNRMFGGAWAFNHPIDSWDTSSVTDMSWMFSGAWAFDHPIGSWDTALVTDMSSMFRWAKEFNQPIGGWNTSSVSDMSSMFHGARLFNRNLSDWCVGQIPTRPLQFDDGANAWVEPRPLWGTCPQENLLRLSD